MIAIILLAIAALIAFAAACIAIGKMVDVVTETDDVTTQAFCVFGLLICAIVGAISVVLLVSSPIMLALEMGWI